MQVDKPQIKLDLSSAGCATAAEEILMISTWLARSKVPDRTIRREELTALESRAASCFVERFGILGEDLSTLQSVGDRYDISRERVRQLVVRLASRSRIASFVTPRIDEVAAAIKQNTLLTIVEFDSRYRQLLGEKLSVESVDRFSREILGTSIATFSYGSAAKYNRPGMKDFNRILTETDRDESIVNAARNAARSMIRSCGAAHILMVAGAIIEMEGRSVTVADTISALKTINGFDWLIESAGWFWFGPEAPNRALIMTRKVLSVAQQPVDVSDLHQALCRSRRIGYNEDHDTPYQVEMTWQVLRKLLSKSPDFQIFQKNDFELIQKNPREDLSEKELLICGVMEDRGGIVARNVLFNQLVKTGKMSTISLQQALAWSPIIERMGFSIYRLRGWPIDAEALSRAQIVARSAKKEEMPDQGLADETV